MPWRWEPGPQCRRLFRLRNQIQAPVDCDVFNPLTVKPDGRIFQAEGINIVTVANVTPIKGLENFIEIANYTNKFVKGKFKINFWIVGSVYANQQKYLNILYRY